MATLQITESYSFANTHIYLCVIGIHDATQSHPYKELLREMYTVKYFLNTTNEYQKSILSK